MAYARTPIWVHVLHSPSFFFYKSVEAYSSLFLLQSAASEDDKGTSPTSTKRFYPTVPQVALAILVSLYTNNINAKWSHSEMTNKSLIVTTADQQMNKRVFRVIDMSNILHVTIPFAFS